MPTKISPVLRSVAAASLSSKSTNREIQIAHRIAIECDLSGEAYIVRFADDFVSCFELESDAMRYRTVLPNKIDKPEVASEIDDDADQGHGDQQ